MKIISGCCFTKKDGIRAGFCQTKVLLFKKGGRGMIIQSRKVWLADQFVEAQIEIEDGKIVNVFN